MELSDFLDAMGSQAEVVANSETHRKMHELSQQALRITAEINGRYHTPEELRALMQELTNGGVGDNFGLFPPFYTDCGKNIRIGSGVFINAGCQFQDQGGITIGDDSLIGPKTVIATLNHDMQPEARKPASGARADRITRLDRRKLHDPARRDDRRRRGCGSRSGGDQRRRAAHVGRRRARKSYQND